MILVNKETLKQNIKCPFDFACLKDQHFPKCVVDYSIKNNVVFVKEVREENCPYKMSFGDAHICHCPTRYEIYEKHKKQLFSDTKKNRSPPCRSLNILPAFRANKGAMQSSAEYCPEPIEGPDQPYLL